MLMPMGVSALCVPPNIRARLYLEPNPKSRLEPTLPSGAPPSVASRRIVCSASLAGAPDGPATRRRRERLIIHCSGTSGLLSDFSYLTASLRSGKLALGKSNGMTSAPCGHTSEPALVSPMSVAMPMSAERPESETRRLPNGSRNDLESSSRPR